jgi:uncharacterized protein with von Willebrand factor type A (vWA) domain
MQLGDSRTGKLAANIAGFGRALRRAGVRMDSARIALAQEAALLVGVDSKPDLSAAMESVMVSREQDRMVFRELFDVYFRNPEVANKLLSQLLPSAEGKAEPSKRRPRVREALQPQKAFGQQAAPKKEDQKVEFDAAMTASDLQRLKHADFSALSASEYHLVERLARDVALPRAAGAVAPGAPGRAWPPHALAGRDARAARTGGEIMQLRRLQRQRQPLPLLVLVDVSGSMERYARLLLAFLHAATRNANGHRAQRDVFAFGTHLTDLTPAFRLADTDAMLARGQRADRRLCRRHPPGRIAGHAAPAACAPAGGPAHAGAGDQRRAGHRRARCWTPSWPGCAGAAAACCGSIRCCALTAIRRWRAARLCCTVMPMACWRCTTSPSLRNWRAVWPL